MLGVQVNGDHQLENLSIGGAGAPSPRRGPQQSEARSGVRGERSRPPRALRPRCTGKGKPFSLCCSQALSLPQHLPRWTTRLRPSMVRAGAPSCIPASAMLVRLFLRPSGGSAGCRLNPIGRPPAAGAPAPESSHMVPGMSCSNHAMVDVLLSMSRA